MGPGPEALNIGALLMEINLNQMEAVLTDRFNDGWKRRKLEEGFPGEKDMALCMYLAGAHSAINWVCEKELKRRGARNEIHN